MKTRADRIEARVQPERAKRIRFASRLLQTSVSAFVVDAAAEKAEQVIAEHTYTSVPSRYFERLLAALDEPPVEIPALVEAAERVRKGRAFKQR
jgi:uncharacterized protein (DUF1778 family)